MRTIVDTSSLVILARYYHPFDSTENLDDHLREEIRNGSLIVLDKVLTESRHVAQGLAYNTFSCLREKKIARDSAELIPSNRFFNMLDNNFVDRVMKRTKFAEDIAGYTNERDKFLNSADCAMIVFAMNKNSVLDPIRILTEESVNQNDGKLFKKIPLICSELNIPTITAVDYLKQASSLRVEVTR